MAPFEITLDLSPGIEALPRCRNAVFGAALKAGFSDQDAQDIAAAVFEACANAATYGAGKGPMSLQIRVNDYKFVAVVRDSGKGFSCPPDSPMPPASSPRGRGIPLMRMLMDEVRFEFTPGCKVTLVKNIPR